MYLSHWKRIFLTDFRVMKVWRKFSLYLTNRFQVAVRLFSNRSKITSKCGKNKKVAHEAQPSVSLMWHGNLESICFI